MSADSTSHQGKFSQIISPASLKPGDTVRPPPESVLHHVRADVGGNGGTEESLTPTSCRPTVRRASRGRVAHARRSRQPHHSCALLLFFSLGSALNCSLRKMPVDRTHARLGRAAQARHPPPLGWGRRTDGRCPTMGGATTLTNAPHHDRKKHHAAAAAAIVEDSDRSERHHWNRSHPLNLNAMGLSGNVSVYRTVGRMTAGRRSECTPLHSALIRFVPAAP